ncbi:META domain-containing protein [Streptomyces sp. NPDC017056]|uniref:META domain-containing protein n=1 Tax=Streptomyces sp. NPDC017056 TaxID=3364973 RepID=UPI003795104E
MALVAALSACGAKTGPDGVAEPDGESPARSRIAGTHWNVERLTLDDGTTTAPHGSAWIEFDGRGHAAGSFGCHRFRAGAEVNAAGDRVRVGDIEAYGSGESEQSEEAGQSEESGQSGDGKPECSRERLAFESYMKKIFRGDLRIIGGASQEMVLVALGNERKDRLQLQRGRSAPLLGTKWTVNSLIDGDTQVGPAELAPGVGEVSVVFEGDGTVHGFLGCNSFKAKAEVGEKSMKFSEAAVTTHNSCGQRADALEARLLRDFRKDALFSLGHDYLNVTTDAATPSQAGGFHAKAGSRRSGEEKEGERK